MTLKHLHAVLAITIGCAFVGCRSEVDLNNIDSTSQLGLGIALPVGTLNLTVGDLIGDVQNLYVDTLKNKGVLTFQIDTTISRYYHQVDLAKHVSETTLGLNVYKKLKEHPALAAMLTANGKITGTGDPIVLDFPITLKLNGINNASSVLGERLDSALIDSASFTSIIDTSHLPLQWEWIDKVTLDLGPQINRSAGNTMVVYDKKRDTDPSKYGYRKNVPTDVDNFSIVLMKNRNAKTFAELNNNNTIDTCVFTVHFQFTIPNGKQVEVPEDAKFSYKLGVKFIDYTAIWGMFQPSSDMHSEEVVDLGDSWGALDFITRSSIPFSDPVVNVNIGTKVAGALMIDSAYIFGIDHNGNRTDATFEDGKTYRRVTFEEGEWLSLKSQIGDSTTKMNVTFDNTPRGGQIHRLFRNVPQKLGYKFAVKFEESQTPQIRVTNNTAIKVKATATLPFMFNEGLDIQYADTAKDINLKPYSIDSLLANVKEVDSVHVNELRIILNAENNIPLCVKACIRCLDSRDSIIKDPVDATKPLLFFEEDTIRLTAPTFANSDGWHKAAPGTTQIMGYLTQDKLDLLPDIKKIVYTVFIDDESLKEAYKQGLTKVSIKNTDKLGLRIGLAANVDARLNFNNQNQNQK